MAQFFVLVPFPALGVEAVVVVVVLVAVLAVWRVALWVAVVVWDFVSENLGIDFGGVRGSIG